MEHLTTVYYRIEGKPNDLQEIYDQYRTLLNKKLLHYSQYGHIMTTIVQLYILN